MRYQSMPSTFTSVSYTHLDVYKRQGRIINYDKNKTPTRGREVTFLEQVFGAVGRSPVAPVSYTHLDVYKRQKQDTCCAICPIHNPRKAINAD